MLLAILLSFALAHAAPYHEQGAVQERIFASFGPAGVKVYDALDGSKPLLESEFTPKIAPRLREQIFAWMNKDAKALNAKALELYKAQKAAQAIPYAEQAFEITYKALGKEHPAVIKSIGFISELYRVSGQTEAAAMRLSGLIDMLSKVYGSDADGGITSVLNKLIAIYSKSGNAAELEPLYRMALDAEIRLNGKKSKKAVDIMLDLALLYDSLGRLADAEPLYKEATELAEEVYGPNHPKVASGLNNLGLIYYASGRHRQAEPLYARALKIYREAYGKDHASVSTMLNNLALLNTALGRYEEAKKDFRVAIEIDERLYGANHINVMTDLNNLATLLKELGDLAGAEPLYRRALKIGETLGIRDQAVASIMNNLGMIYYTSGKLKQAEPLFEGALDTGRAALGPDHPEVSAWAGNLALLYASMGRHKESLDLFSKTMQIEYKKRDDIFTFMSDDQRMRYMKGTEDIMHAFISLTAQYFSNDPVAMRTALDAWFKWKGAVMETQQRYTEAILSSGSLDVKTRYEELTSIRQRLAKLKTTGPMQISEKVFNDTVNSLEYRKQELESELGRLSRDYALERTVGAATVDKVLRALPPDAAYLDYAYITSYDFSKRTIGELKYYLFVLTQRGVNIVEVGSTEKVNIRIKAFLEEMRSMQLFGDLPRVNILREDGAILHKLLIGPAAPYIKASRRLMVSPDGNINLIPFDVLVGPDGRYMIEDYEISYVTAGMDVMRFSRPVTESKVALLFSDPEYDTPAQGVSPQGGGSSRSMLSDAAKGLRFKRLPDTKAETESIARILTGNYGFEAHEFSGAEAVEARLFEYDSPRILHLATHAFFLEDTGVSPSKKGSGSGVVLRDRSSAGYENAMLRSGIVFSGANVSLKQGREEGILSAYKALGLRLGGTDMVVLSACDTGTGKVELGEGVFGLRRAFIVAGARSLIMSLWSVPSRETKELMTDFYTLAATGKGKSEALRQAKIGIMRKYENPIFWGAFVLSGNPQ